jgi:hypothetical protein
MGQTKAPGMDSLPDLFYQRHWALLKDEVWWAVRDFSQWRPNPKDFNDTIVVLIRKVSSLKLLTQFRPIILCNVLYV